MKQAKATDSFVHNRECQVMIAQCFHEEGLCLMRMVRSVRLTLEITSVSDWLLRGKGARLYPNSFRMTQLASVLFAVM